jgi:hypothetical protein
MAEELLQSQGELQTQVVAVAVEMAELRQVRAVRE